MLIQLSFSTIYTFLDEIVRMIDSEYIVLYRDHFLRIPLYTYISFHGPSHLPLLQITRQKCASSDSSWIWFGLAVACFSCQVWFIHKSLLAKKLDNMIIIKEFDFYISEIVDAIEIRCDANLVNLIQPDLICLFKRENNFVHF